MDIKDIKTLIKLVTDTDITEFEMETEEQRIVIKRGKDQEVIHMSAPNYAAPLPVAPQAAAAVPSAVAPVAEVAVNDKYDAITSPIVGTFYAAPSPESDDYVKVGDVVEAGQTLCIVEAMKLMNEIEAEFKCKIVEFVKDNAQPVEFGDALFLVEKL
ncbi:MAG: acetyl-CoA carboxylase, biotin carboxyl carrier protein [Desulfuromonadales bacterium C00003068]|jgi:acetyl-CoA carboxylase biotin carboxyl carrier protein|nr:MAG: acetyl-CoA carboxylase, biotin carboxyl carrier protein [Desulfuromonadales bacterium C00003068]